MQRRAQMIKATVTGLLVMVSILMGQLALANLQLLQVSVTPSQSEIATDRASNVSLTFRSSEEFVLDGGSFCSEVETFGSAPTCPTFAILGNASGSSGSGYAMMHRLNLNVPASIAQQLDRGNLFYVQSLDSAIGTTRVVVRLTPAAATGRETGKLDVTSGQIFALAQGQRITKLLDLGSPQSVGAQVYADLRISGLGRLSGWWVMETRAGRKRVQRFTIGASASGRVRLRGPDLADLVHQFAGRSKIDLEFDRLTSVAVTGLTYIVPPHAITAKLKAWEEGGRLYWSISNAPTAYAIRVEGSDMRWPVLLPLSATGTPLPNGAQTVHLVARSGAAITNRVPLEP